MKVCFKLGFGLALILFLSACHEGSVEYRASAGGHGGSYYDDYPSRSDLTGFYIVDSAGYSSEFDAGPYRLDPYQNDGLFELYWYVRGYGDYDVNIYLNDRSSLAGAVLVGSEYCRSGQSCDDGGLYVCDYGSNFTLGCGIDLYEAQHNKANIEQLFTQVPDRLYLHLELCDGYDCELRTVPVTME